MPDREEAVDFLARAPLFADLEGRSLRRLASLCVTKVFPQGAVLLEEGTTGLGLLLITAGKVEVYKGRGDSKLSLAVLGVGDLLGEMALLDDRPRSATAVALEPTSCLLITRANFQSLLRKDPEIGWCVVPVLAGRLRDLEERLLEREEERGGEVVPSAPRAPEAEEEAGEEEEEEEEEEEDEGDAVLHLLRTQYAVMEAMAAGVTGAARVVETFLDVLASKTELDDQQRVRDLLRDLPRGLAAAAESALDESEKLPEQVLSRLRWNRTRGDDS